MFKCTSSYFVAVNSHDGNDQANIMCKLFKYNGTLITFQEHLLIPDQALLTISEQNESLLRATRKYQINATFSQLTIENFSPLYTFMTFIQHSGLDKTLLRHLLLFQEKWRKTGTGIYCKTQKQRFYSYFLGHFVIISVIMLYPTNNL